MWITNATHIYPHVYVGEEKHVKNERDTHPPASDVIFQDGSRKCLSFDLQHFKSLSQDTIPEKTPENLRFLNIAYFGYMSLFVIQDYDYEANWSYINRTCSQDIALWKKLQLLRTTSLIFHRIDVALFRYKEDTFWLESIGLKTFLSYLGHLIVGSMLKLRPKTGILLLIRGIIRYRNNQRQGVKIPPFPTKKICKETGENLETILTYLCVLNEKKQIKEITYSSLNLDTISFDLLHQASDPHKNLNVLQLAYGNKHLEKSGNRHFSATHPFQLSVTTSKSRWSNFTWKKGLLWRMVGRKILHLTLLLLKTMKGKQHLLNCNFLQYSSTG